MAPSWSNHPSTPPANVQYQCHPAQFPSLGPRTIVTTASETGFHPDLRSVWTLSAERA